MSDFEKIYDPKATIPGTAVELKYVMSGECRGGVPAVTVDTIGFMPSPDGNEHKMDGGVPRVKADIRVGCENYIRLRNLPMPVEIRECFRCPDLNIE